MRNLFFLAALPLLTLAACNSMHAGHEEADEGPEVKVPIDQVPPAVRTTLQTQAPGAAIASVDKETDAGRTIYEADATIAGKNWEIKVAEDGSLVSKKIDDEKDEGKDEKDEDKK